MEFYLSRAGAQTGPFRLFQIKEMLDRGEATPGDLAWHEGAAAWRPLREMEVVQPFLPKGTVPPPLPTSQEDTSSSEAFPSVRRSTEEATPPTKSAIFRDEALPRAMARLIDMTFAWVTLFGIALLLRKIELWHYLTMGPFYKTAGACLWVFAEAFFLSRWGATPGKWLFGLKVVSRADGGLLTWREALNRSISVWFRGWGFGLHPLVTALSSLFQLQTLLHTRSTPWDYLYQSRVIHHGLSVRGLIFFVGGMVAVAIGQGIALSTPPPLNAPERAMWERELKPVHDMQQQLLQLLRQPPGTQPAGSKPAESAPPTPTVPPSA